MAKQQQQVFSHSQSHHHLVGHWNRCSIIWVVIGTNVVEHGFVNWLWTIGLPFLVTPHHHIFRVGYYIGYAMKLSTEGLSSPPRDVQKRIDNYWNFPTYTQQNCGFFSSPLMLLQHIRLNPLITKTPTGVWTYTKKNHSSPKIPSDVWTPRSILQKHDFFSKQCPVGNYSMMPQKSND